MCTVTTSCPTICLRLDARFCNEFGTSLSRELASDSAGGDKYAANSCAALWKCSSSNCFEGVACTSVPVRCDGIVFRAKFATVDTRHLSFFKELQVLLDGCPWLAVTDK